MEDEQRTPQDLSSIYVSDEVYETEIGGILFKWKELTGVEVTEALGHVTSEAEFDKIGYLKRLIKLAVIEPEELEVERLKAHVLTMLAAKIEASLGLNEVVQKNSNPKSGENQDSMQ